MDQFYTQNQVAKTCWSILQQVLCEIQEEEAYHYIEPSAGDGAFFRLLPVGRRVGLDLEPRARWIRQGNFYHWHPTGRMARVDRSRRVVVGNPPFGSRGHEALSFFNHALFHANTAAFIVPVCFRKYTLHKKMPDDAQLILQMSVPTDGFRLPDGSLYKVNTEFQIWTRLDTPYPNTRLMAPPPTSHSDFVIRQYNNTKGALKHFEKPFQLAVPCQGWQDYTRRETKADACEKNKQWMLFEAEPSIIKRLSALDYTALAHRTGTITPGFRKNDLVKEYIHAYE